jgi:glutamate-ammonia-ligase adenylyltransferase
MPQVIATVHACQASGVILPRVLTSRDELAVILERLRGLGPVERDSLVLEQSDPERRTWLLALLHGPDPEGALQRALSLPAALLREPPSRTAAALLQQGSYPARLMRLLDVDTVREVLADIPVAEPETGRMFELFELFDAALRKYDLAEAIARVRTRVYLSLARRELEHAPLEEVGGALSDLAGCCIDTAMRGIDPQLCEQVSVFGMGKLGGRELNFLSDIDLVFVHADEATAGPDEATVHRLRTGLHERLRRVLRLLEGSGVWRPLFHVDLRLRPFGSRGPLSLSISALERYYERHGRGWERQAWLRARPVAGNLELGNQLLARLAPFVWPRSLGPSVFEEVAEMMKRARAQARASIGSANVDLKHDAGGIREIEFFVQCLQLLNGGRDPNLRTRSTLGACDRLAAAGLLSDREHEILARAYRELRRIEHRVQLCEGQQTHRVPSDPVERELLARRLAIGAPPTWLIGAERLATASSPAPPQSLAEFDHALVELRGQVQEITGTLTGESELAGSRASEREVAQAVLVDPGSSPRSRRDALAACGLRPEAVDEIEAMLEHLLSREDGALTSSGAGLMGARRLLLACLDSADPVEAVRRLVEFAATRPAHLGVWRLMAEPEQEQLVRQVADLFGASEPLSRGLIGFGRGSGSGSGSTHDGGLALLLEANASDLPDATELRERFATATAKSKDKPDGTQSLDERLLRFKHRELVRIGLYDLGRRPDPLAIGRSLSDLADLIVRELLADLASSGRDPDSGRGRGDQPSPGFTLAVLAIGKFGMQAMDYGSDLDLMFVYEPDPGVTSTAVRDAAQQVSRKLLARLQDRSGGLRLYEVDMRLRPSGNQGLLVSSLEGFRSYHARPLEVWERLALVRLRGVTEQHFGRDAVTPSDHVLSQTLLEEVVPSSVWAAVDPAHVAAETRRLKQRIESELARETRDHWNVKTGVGGVLELELLTSALQLSHDVRAREIPTALRELAERALLDHTEAAALDGAYRFERRLLNRLRMSRSAGWGEDDRLPLNSPRLTALARRMGVADRDALISTLERQRAIIRAAFDRYLPSHDGHDGDH